MGATLEIKFNTDNQAVSDDPSGEAIRILKSITQQIEDSYGHDVHGYIRDLNGNRIGEWELATDPQEEIDY